MEDSGLGHPAGEQALIHGDPESTTAPPRHVRDNQTRAICIRLHPPRFRWPPVCGLQCQRLRAAARRDPSHRPALLDRQGEERTASERISAGLAQEARLFGPRSKLVLTRPRLFFSHLISYWANKPKMAGLSRLVPIRPSFPCIDP
ncbi:hypothetical protein C2845_PM11G26640 [Panicum miliaceum]|uniref:Uncharacterized protein n=1 Tax=Panicum miliaceum TaxID=4540 RepID=A0A3L6RPG5_PANMI|nr:hypothetical protein C2845_PM11G26640 [Panicum miliaceum]